MAARKQDPKIMDVSKPGKTKVSPTSRPVILSHGPTVKDPTVLPSNADGDTTLIAPHGAMTSQTKKKIMPLSDDEKAKHSQSGDTAEPEAKAAAAEPVAPPQAVEPAEPAPAAEPEAPAEPAASEEPAAAEPVSAVETEADSNIVKVTVKSKAADTAALPAFDLSKPAADTPAEIKAAADAAEEKDATDQPSPISSAAKPETTGPAVAAEAATETEAAETAAADAETAESKAADDKDPEAKDVDETDMTAPAGSESAAIGALAQQADAKKDSQKAIEEAAAKEAELAKATEAKKYFVPVGHDSRKSGGKAGWILLVLLILIAGAYLAIDAGVVKINNFEVPYHVIGTK